MQPNLLKLLEEIDAICDELRSVEGTEPMVSDIESKVGEILTLIGGR